MKKMATVEVEGGIAAQTNMAELMRLFKDKQNEVKVQKKRLDLNKSYLSKDEFRDAIDSDLDIWIKAYMKDDIAVFEFYITEL